MDASGLPEAEEGTTGASPPDAGDPARTSRRRATADIVIQIAGRLLNVALGVVVTAIVARALGDDGFGVWSTLLVVVQLAANLAEVGLERVTIRQIAADRAREPDWMGSLLTLRTALSVVASLVAAAAIVVLADSSEMLVAGLVLCALLVVTAPGVLAVRFQFKVRNEVPVLVMTINSIAWTGAAAILAATNRGLVPLAVAFVLVSGATALLQALIARRSGPIHLRGSRQRWPLLLRLGIPLGISTVLITAYAKIDQALVFQFGGAGEAGQYGAAYRILDQLQFLPIVVMTTLFPIVAGAHEAKDRPKVLAAIQAAADYLAMASLGVFAFTLVASEPVIELVYGSGFVPAAGALPVLAGAFVLICYGYLAGNLVVLLHLQRRFVYYALAALLFNVAANVILIPEYGFLAAAWVTVATEMLVLSLTMRLVMRELPFRLRMGRALRAVAAATGLALATLAVREAGGGLVALLATATVAYGALLFATRALTVGELRSLVRREIA